MFFSLANKNSRLVKLDTDKSLDSESIPQAAGRMAVGQEEQKLYTCRLTHECTHVHYARDMQTGISRV